MLVQCLSLPLARGFSLNIDLNMSLVFLSPFLIVSLGTILYIICVFRGIHSSSLCDSSPAGVPGSSLLDVRLLHQIQ